MEFTSCMKDYYDIYYLSNKFNFDGETLKEALIKTFVNRGRKYNVEDFSQVLTFGADSGMQKKWKAFLFHFSHVILYNTMSFFH